MEHPMLMIAERAILKAGKVAIKKSFDLEDLEITEKSHNDFVTEADLAVEQVVMDTILRAYPNHSILSEESGFTGNEDAEYCWIIDPIDGTNNYIHGIPHYAISIALKQNNKLILGLIYNPSQDHLFVAVKGAGSLLNRKKLRVKNSSSMKGALISMALPRKEIENKEAFFIARDILRKEISGYRYTGSLALDLAYAAAGWYDVVWFAGSNIWDIAAGVLLVKEAGGLVCDIYGGVSYLESGQLIAGNPKSVPKMVKYFSKLV